MLLSRVVVTFLFVVSLNFSWGQTGPGGVGNASSNVLWLSADVGVFSDAGTTPASNTDDVGQWNDRSGNLRHASHATPAQRPNYQTNVINGFPVIRFAAGSGDRLLSANVTSGNAASIWAVASWATLPSSNPGIIQGAPTGSPFASNTNEKVIGLWVSNVAPNRVWGRGVQANGTQRDISQVTGTSVNTFYSFLNHYNGTNLISQYVNNSLAGDVAYNGTLGSWSEFGIGRQAAESWNGDIAEVIAYNVSVNAAQRIIVDNYLAAKYGLTLSPSDIYTMDDPGNGNYDFEVAGIGRVDASNIHSDAQGTGIIRILNPGGLGDNEFLMWGHNNGTLQATDISDIPPGVTARFARTWRVSEVGEVGSIDLQADLTGLPDLSTISACDVALSLGLLVDTDNDGVFADESPISGAINMGGGIFRFNNVNSISNEMRFTLALVTKTNNGPGGVGNASMWWRADAGVTASAGLITTWADQSGNGNHLTAAGGARPALATSASMNNQSVVRYSGAQYFSSAFSGPGVDNLTLFLAANGSSYQSLFRFQNSGSPYVVYPWEQGGGRTFISSSDGGTDPLYGVPSGLVNNVNNVGGARYQRNTTNGMRTYLNGNVNAQRTPLVNSPLPSQPFYSGIYAPGSSEFPNCDVGEMVAYYSALNDAQVVIVQNYLAAKYNVGLTANDTYRADNAGNGNFDYDVAGIGRVNATNIHSDARGTGWVRILNPTNLGDNEFLMWGHDNGSISNVNTSDIPAGIQARLNRVWRVSEANAAGSGAVVVGNVDLQIDLSALNSPITASDLRLLIDHDGDGVFNEAGTIQISGATAVACDNYLFSGIPDGNLTHGDRFTIGSINILQTPLPITLESFTGSIVESQAYLQWTTASEKDNDFFTVERSTTGQNFYSVGTVPGAGTSMVRRHYEFIDSLPPYGKVYYRLKQTDYDKKVTYSEIILLKNESQGLNLITVPNPLTSGKQLKLRVTHSEQIDLTNSYLTVSDVTGRNIPVTATTENTGLILLAFDTTPAPGIYIISLRSPVLTGPVFSRLLVID